MNIFEMLYPRFYFDKSKPIRLFEAFAGVGCQAMALKRITDNTELVGISEIDKYAIQSYTAIHGEVNNYGDITKMEMIPERDIFTWSFPCTDLSKAGKQKGLTNTRSGLVYEVLRLLKSTDKKPKVLIMENVIDLVQVKFVKPFNEIQAELEQLGYTNYNEVLNAKDFGIPQNRERVFMVSILGDELSEHYSYDFPLRQELKLRLKDLLEDEVDEKYYLSKKALKTLTAPNTGKYQRAKAFEFNIKKTIEQGIIGSITAGDRSSALDSYYAEPQLIQVAQLDGFVAQKYRNFYDKNGYIPNAFNPYNESEIIDITPTLTSQSGSTTSSASILIKEATEKGYAEAQDGDGVYINRPHQKRGVVQKGMIQTIKTSGDDVGVVVKDKQNLKEQMCEQLISDGKVQENDVIRHSYTKSRMRGEMKDIQENNISPTLDTRADCLGVVVAAEIRTDEGIRTFDDNNMGALRTTGSCDDKVVIELSSKNKRLKSVVENNDFNKDDTKNIDIFNQKVSDISQTLTLPNHNSQAVYNNLRIRKLTPIECWRLMGISDEDFNKAKASGVSNSQLYKQAGNGIVVNVFEAILRELIK